MARSPWRRSPGRTCLPQAASARLRCDPPRAWRHEDPSGLQQTTNHQRLRSARLRLCQAWPPPPRHCCSGAHVRSHLFQLQPQPKIPRCPPFARQIPGVSVWFSTLLSREREDNSSRHTACRCRERLCKHLDGRAPHPTSARKSSSHHGHKPQDRHKADRSTAPSVDFGVVVLSARTDTCLQRSRNLWRGVARRLWFETSPEPCQRAQRATPWTRLLGT
mmetsp:Transcript_27026/g.71087  ORF Transcript_27026/g.71087 Transcript_27026/m.71087 type:complete len:219 (+) Transcript_27026:2068-2724(+)